ncbi:4922_t:CDS:2, partial [Gigaspora rosea]
MEQIERPDVLIDSLPYIDQEIDYEGITYTWDRISKRVQQGKPITEMDTSGYKLIELKMRNHGRKQLIIRMLNYIIKII